MNALIKKEIRLLLPSWAVALVLASAGLFFPNNPNSVLTAFSHLIGYAFCPAVAVLLALSSFGTEIGSGTFSNLLAQPIARLKIWKLKISLLTLALLSIILLWVAAFGINQVMDVPQHQSLDQWLDLLSVIIVSGLVIFSGGLWTVLLLRQMASAFWFTLLTPGILLMIMAAFFSEQDGNLFAGMIISSLGLYSLAGFLFARWLFLRAQDVPWSSGNITMPKLGGWARWQSAKCDTRKWNPRAALWRKELMLHQSQLVVAFALAALHLGVLGARLFLDLSRSPDLKYGLGIFWGLWLFMPLLIGCVAVAEERSLGTHEGQLCLPVKCRTQFGIKFKIALGLSLLLGVAMPLLFEGTRILPNSPPLLLAILPADWLNEVLIRAFYRSLPLLLWTFFAGATCTISFYVSSLSKNTLQSLAPAVLGTLLATTLLAVTAWSGNLEHDFLWSGPLPFIIVIPTMAMTLLWLAFKNFLQPRTSLRMGCANFATLTGALVLAGIMTSAVYHRLWEVFEPAEPAHGPAKLTLANPPVLDLHQYALLVKLPDGRVWFDYLSYSRWWHPGGYQEQEMWLKLVPESAGPEQFLSGSNWASASAQHVDLWMEDKATKIEHHVTGFTESFGIKTDGTLWASDKSDQKRWTASVLSRVGDATDWKAAKQEYFNKVYLLKQNGTLWRWGLGTNPYDWKQWPQNWPGLRVLQPQQIGNASDWKEFFPGDEPWVRKNDGSVWRLWSTGMKHMTNYDQISFRQQSENIQLVAGVRDNGTLWIYGDLHYHNHDDFEMRQSGQDTNWVAASLNWQSMVALKSDGTLWKWNSDFQVPAIAYTTQPSRMGSHNDWVALTSARNGVVTLAADGGLWFWPEQNYQRYWGALLKTPKQPQFLANVFGNKQ